MTAFCLPMRNPGTLARNDGGTVIDKQDAQADDRRPQEPTADEKPEVAAADTATEQASRADASEPAEAATTETPATDTPDTRPSAAEPREVEPPTTLIEKPAAKKPVAEPMTARMEKPAAADAAAVLPTVRVDRRGVCAPRPAEHPAEPATVVIPAVRKPAAPEAEAATVVIAAVEKPAAPAQPVASERTHTPPSGRKLLLIGAAAVVLVAVIAIGLALAGNNSGDNSPRGQVTRAVKTYTKALIVGDLPTLRSITTGSLQNFYNTVPNQQFAEVYQTSLRQGTIPTLRSVDIVEVDGNTAKAQLRTGDADHPGPSYSVNLAQTSGGWRITGP